MTFSTLDGRHRFGFGLTMQSMTGYGRKAARIDTFDIVVEVAAVNRKNLEIVVSGPKDWFDLDRAVTELGRQRFERGRLQVQVKVEQGLDSTSQPESVWPEAVIQQRVTSFTQLCETLGVDCVWSADLLVQLMRLNGGESRLPDWETHGASVLDVVNDAFEALAQMRIVEGEALLQDLKARLEILRRIASSIAAIASEVPAIHRKLLFERLSQAELELDPSDERVLKEIALFADRSDITEELTRLNSHFSQLEATLHASGAIGRKIDFILQELFREFNTIGSKANHFQISQSVIEGKNELERLREQALNVE